MLFNQLVKYKKPKELVKYKKPKDLPIELIMIIYEYANCKEKAVLNQCYKLNYKKFNPILGLPLKLLSSISSHSYQHVSCSINGKCYITINERKVTLGDTINSLKKENIRLNNKIDFLILLLQQKHNINIQEINI